MANDMIECPDCDGTGEGLLGDVCAECHGEGEVSPYKHYYDGVEGLEGYYD